MGLDIRRNTTEGHSFSGEKPLIIEVDGLPVATTLERLFAEYALDATWPKPKCGACGNGKYYYARDNHALAVIGSANVVLPDTHHDPGKNLMPDGTRCRYAVREGGVFRHNPKNTADPEKNRNEFLRPENMVRAEAVLQDMLKRNYSEEVLDRLVGVMDERKMWAAGAPVWSIPYVMVQLVTFENFEFGTGKTADVRFVPTEDRSHLQIVRAKTGQPVHKYYPTYEVSEDAANEVMNDRPFQPMLFAPSADALTFA